MLVMLKRLRQWRESEGESNGNEGKESWIEFAVHGQGQEQVEDGIAARVIP